MRYLRQFGIIILFSFMGELLNEFLPFSVPAGIYGFVLMMLALVSGVVKLPDVKETGDFLLEIMPLLFIPAAAGLLDCWGILKEILIPVLLICTLGTLITMAATGIVTQSVVRAGKKFSEQGGVQEEKRQSDRKKAKREGKVGKQ